MSVDEMKTLVSELVEEKLMELLGDPDADKQLRKSVSSRLKASFDAEAQGVVGTPATEFVRKLGL